MTDKLRMAAQQTARKRLEFPIKDDPVAAALFWLDAALRCPGFDWDHDQKECAEGALRAALAQQDAQAVTYRWIPPSGLKVADIGFRWDGDALQHVPHVLVEFEPVPANLPNTEKGWADRDAFVEMLNAAPTPPAPKPLGWLDRKAVECLQGAELNWMPAWNRPTSADPVPVFLGPPTRATLTASEILNMTPESIPAEHDGALLEYARAVIEAYKIKNGLKP